MRSECDNWLVHRVSINNKLPQNINLALGGNAKEPKKEGDQITHCCSVHVSEPSWKQDVLFAFVSDGWNSAGVNSLLYFVKALRCRAGEKKGEKERERGRKRQLCLPSNT